MAFNKKKKRKIVVDGKQYYWSATGGDNCIGLTVMTDIQGSAKLICHFDYHQIPVKGDSFVVDGIELNVTFLTNQFIITSYTVRQVIEYALSQSWKPFEKGEDLFLGSLDDKIDLRLDKNRKNNFKK